MKKYILYAGFILVSFFAFFLLRHPSNSISVIIPVYNAERYLQRCLDSILTQKGHFNIIAINDGSTDNSLKILENYAKKYSNIQIITQENKGVSAARNAGIKAAKGNYITFIDSDDWLEANAFKKALSLIEKKNPDILLTGFYDVYDLEWVKNTGREEFIADLPAESRYPNHNLDKLELFSPFYGNEAHSDLFYVGGGVRGRFYKKEFLDKYNIRFPENISCHEDDFFNIRAFLHNPLIAVTKLPLYNYRNRTDGLSKSQNVLQCAPQSLAAIQNTEEYKEANRRLQMIITDNWLFLFIHGLSNISRYRPFNDDELNIAYKAYKDFFIYNREELKICRNFQKLKDFFNKNNFNHSL